MSLDAFHRDVQTFVGIQARLVAVFLATVLGGQRDVLDLDASKRSGTLVSEGETWSYQVHGSGVLFQDPTKKLAVDVHRRLDSPHGFDVWRLQTYFGSRRKGKKHTLPSGLGSDADPYEKRIRAGLDALTQQGRVRSENGLLFLV